MNKNPQAKLVAILGVAALFFLPLGPVAWIVGSRAVKEIDRTGGDEGRRAANAGRLLGVVATGLLVLLLIIALFAGTSVGPPSSQ